MYTTQGNIPNRIGDSKACGILLFGESAERTMHETYCSSVLWVKCEQYPLGK